MTEKPHKVFHRSISQCHDLSQVPKNPSKLKMPRPLLLLLLSCVAATSASSPAHLPELTATAPPGGCLACGHRDALKRASLESIKPHVLLKLGFHQAMPDLHHAGQTHFPAVPAHLLQNFLHQNGGQHYAPSPHQPLDDQMMGDQAGGGASPEGGREVVEEEEDDYYPTPSTIYALSSE